MPEWECAKVNGNPIDTFVIKRFVFSQERLKFPHDSDIFELNYYTYWPDEKEERLMNLLLSLCHVAQAVEIQGDDEPKHALGRQHMKITRASADLPAS